HTQPGLSRAIDAGVDVIYHGCFIDDEAIEKMAEKGTYYLPTLKVTYPPNIDSNAARRPWMREKMEPATAPHREGVHKAIEKGVKVGLGSDGPGADWTPGDNTALEISELVNCG